MDKDLKEKIINLRTKDVDDAIYNLKCSKFIKDSSEFTTNSMLVVLKYLDDLEKLIDEDSTGKRTSKEDTEQLISKLKKLKDLQIYFTPAGSSGVVTLTEESKQVIDKIEKYIRELECEVNSFKTLNLVYCNLRKEFNRMVDVILGEDYYNMAMDVYTCDQMTCDDIIDKRSKYGFSKNVRRDDNIRKNIQELLSDLNKKYNNSHGYYLSAQEMIRMLEKILEDK